MIRRSWVRDLRHEDYQREVEAQRLAQAETMTDAEYEALCREEATFWQTNDAIMDELDEGTA